MCSIQGRTIVRLWREPLVVPAYAAVISVAANASHGIWRVHRARHGALKQANDEIHRQATLVSKVLANIKDHGVTLFSFRVLRFLSCIALAVLSILYAAQRGRVVPEYGRDSSKRPLLGGLSDVGHAAQLDIIYAVFYVSSRCK